MDNKMGRQLNMEELDQVTGGTPDGMPRIKGTPDTTSVFGQLDNHQPLVTPSQEQIQELLNNESVQEQIRWYQQQ